MKKCKGIVIAFVVDGDFSTSRIESEQKMQEIVNYHMTIHEATEHELQKEK